MRKILSREANDPEFIVATNLMLSSNIIKYLLGRLFGRGNCIAMQMDETHAQSRLSAGPPLGQYARRHDLSLLPPGMVR